MKKRATEALLRTAYGKLPEREYREGDIARLRAYHDLRATDAAFTLDDITWHDLDMNRLYRRINACLSTAGEQCLYHQLRTPVRDAAELSRLKARISLFERDEMLRLRVQEPLYTLGRAGEIDICPLFRPGRTSSGRQVMYFALALLPALGLALLAAGVASGLLLAVFSMIFNLGFHTWRLSRIQGEFGRVVYAVRTLRAFRALKRLREPKLNALIAPEAFAAYDACGSLARAGVVSQASTSDLSAILSAVFMIDLILFERMKSSIAQRHAELLLVYEALGSLDAAIAIASYRASLDTWCEPELLFDAPAPVLRARGLYHPLLTSPVANDLPEGRALLLTGSNASGKSTFLKSAALCAVMAQTILTCTAQKCALAPLNVYTSIALEDDLESGESYYIVEIKSIKRILDAAQCGEPVFCAVDEVLRGTNTIERIAASSELLRTLERTGAICLAATHDIELCRLLQERFILAHFEERIEEGGLQFDYLLKDGPATTHNAIRLLDASGYPKELVNAAMARAGRFIHEGVWK